MAEIDKPFVGDRYREHLILVLDQFVLEDTSSEQWLKTLIAGAAREMIPTSKALAEKCKTIHDLTGLLIGEPWRRIKGDDFGAWGCMSYFCAHIGQSALYKQVEEVISAISPLPVKIICLTEDIFHCIDPESSFYVRGNVYVKQTYLLDVNPVEILYFKSFNIPPQEVKRYSFLEGCVSGDFQGDKNLMKAQTEPIPMATEKLEFSLPQDFFTGATSSNIIGALKSSVIKAGAGKFAELINLLGRSTPTNEHYSKIGPFIKPDNENKMRLACLLAGKRIEGNQKVEWIGGNNLKTECVIDYLVKYLYENSRGRYKRAFEILGYRPHKPEDGSSYANKANKAVRERIKNIYQGYQDIFDKSK